MRLDELTRKDFLSNIDKRTNKYSKKVKGIKYLGITKDYTIHMSVPSVTSNPATNYLVKINLAEYPSLLDQEDLTIEDKVRLSLDGDLKISCTCPAYLYWGYKYIMTQLSSNSSDDEERFPVVRNKNLEGTLCKHSLVAVRGFGKWWKKIAYDIASGNFI